jgi:hypothetical protein
MTKLRQREPRQRDEKHLAFVRTQPCCLPFCKREAEAAHLRMANLAIGKEFTGRVKPDDKYTVPLCPYHHRTGIDCQHNSNEREWWALRGIDPWKIAASLWIESGGAARALEPKPAPHKRTYDPVKAAVERKKRMPRHVEYCRQPAYKAWKREYDRRYRAAEFGEFAEAYMLAIDLNREIKGRTTNAQIKYENGCTNKSQRREREAHQGPSRNRHSTANR